MSDRWSRLASLTGVLFAVLLAVAIASGSETPDSNAHPVKVYAFYSTHRSEVQTSAILVSLAFLVLLLFAGTLRSYLRRTPGAEGPSALVLAGSVLMAASAWLIAGIEYGLAHQLHNLGPQTAQTLNFLDNELFLPLLGGGFLLALGSGIAILRGAPLPKWLGWIAVLLAIVAIVPPVGFFALFGLALWSLVVSILMYVRGGRTTDAPGAPPPAAAAPPPAQA